MLKGKDRPLVIILKTGSQLDLFERDDDHNISIIKIHIGSPHEELLAFTLARSQLVDEVIIPNLKGKNIVICNRFADSTVAYQGYGRGLDLELVKTANRIATKGIQPDLTILLDVTPEKGLSRKFGITRNTFEKEELDFHKKVRDGYLALAASEPNRWFVIDADKSVDDVAKIIWQRVRQLITEKEK
jgi:dTMP kinase